MHKALETTELISIICDFAGGPYYSCSADVLRLALTCRRFLEPALDVLWHDVYNIAHLLKCFPPDIWMQEETVDWYDGRKLKVLRCPRHQDWKRPRYYAKRVKELYFDPRGVDVTFYDTLAMSCPDHVLFPNLLQLHLSEPTGGDNSIMSFGRLLISPSIQRLNLTTCKWEKSLQAMSFTTFLTSRCKPTHIDISFAGLPDDAVDVIFTDWTHLQSITLEIVQTTMLRRIASFPSLQVLRIRGSYVHPKSIVGELMEVEGHGGFPSLQQVVVRYGTPETCTWLLAMMNRSPVKKLDMYLHSGMSVSAEQWRDILQLLLSAVDHQTLERLVLFDNAVHEDDAHTIYPFSCDFVEPLLCFKGLRRLTFRPVCPVHLDGATLLAMGRALSNLRFLDMRGHRLDHSPTITVHDVVGFALQCPALQTVAFSIDALDHVPWPQSGTVPEGGRRNPSVTKFAVGCATICANDAIIYAAYLSSVFPNLCEVEAWGDGGLRDMTHSRWKDVERLLPLCRELRQQGYLHGLQQQQQQQRCLHGQRPRRGEGSDATNFGQTSSPDFGQNGPANFGRLRNWSKGWPDAPMEDFYSDDDYGRDPE
ncbi:uncharacterized protein SCHCODRAFT_02570238 [Schizophyllum commune H4-8]|uniref:uncharacterized protein n=1 Tax=Schizophyllum commune (strain H4-8 / FGSC 9210) TaxID=578458 RepID=UPI00215EF052|nr:uncharacterized protein SCHCODRAFT_02570238 [Schizophyllum commune H4-8]KAI5896959.1 hypothetical protein SCHCODRAFT_02570238 [Schizophyllum commune H4-8]